MNLIATYHRAPLLGITQQIDVPFGLTVAEIARTCHGVADGVTAWLRAPVGHGHEWLAVPRQMWGYLRPKRGGVLMLCYHPADGGDVFKSVFLIAASVAVLVAAPYLTPILGTLGTALLSTAFLAGTSYLANVLFPTAQQTVGGFAAAGEAERVRAFANVASDSNLLAKEASLPVIAGTRRVSPPEIAHPRAYLESGVQTLERIFACDGHHLLQGVQVEGTPVDDYDGITTEIRDGAEASSVSTFVTRISSPVNIRETLSGFSTDGVALEDQETPKNSEPLWVRFTTKFHADMEEVMIRLQLDAFYGTGSTTARARLPVRFRFRPKGSAGAWTNLPEIHLSGRDAATNLKELRLRWDDDFGAFDIGGEITFEFFQNVPATDHPLSGGATGDQWQADSHFVAGAGLTETRNIQGRRHGLRVTLDSAVHPKGEYEWEIIRGAASAASGFELSTYKLSGTVYSFFEGQNIAAEWRVPADQSVYPIRLAATHATVIVNQQPCQRPGTAILALKSRGQTVRNVTVEGSKYVADWDGAAWATPVITGNPAVHYRNLLGDYLTYHGIDQSLIVEAEFVAWRQECIDRSYEVSAVFAGTSMAEALAQIAEAGFARPRFSDGFGIDWFRSRSAERPAITFSPRNATISVEYNAAESPCGIRATFQNADDGWRDEEIQINAPGATNHPGYDTASYPSIARESLVRRRALFDILQREHQSRRVWTVNTSIEGALCERGTLVSIVTDLVDDTSFGARVRAVIDSTDIEIDQAIPAQSTTSVFDIDDIFTEGNIFETGEQTAVMVSGPNGTEMRNVVAAEGRVIRVDAEFSTIDLEGAHLVMAPLSRFTHRAIVTQIERQGEENATLTCVDEAPEIYETLTGIAA